MSQDHPAHRVLQQAPVAPLDASGFTASLVGTALCALALCGSLIWPPSGHWLQVFATGTALGLCLICYTAWHRNLVKKRAEQEQANVEDPSEATSVA